MESEMVKKALMLCQSGECEGDCPYHAFTDCQSILAKDALNLITFLESDVKYYSSVNDTLIELNQVLTKCLNNTACLLKKVADDGD